MFVEESVEIWFGRSLYDVMCGMFDGICHFGGSYWKR